MSIFLPSGIREIDFLLEDDAIQRTKKMWAQYVSTIPEYPVEKFNGTGIVMCAGGIAYFTCAWICIHNLRRVGCTLPIELWHLGNELSDEVIDALRKLDVDCRDFLSESKTTFKGVSLKPLAILSSKFKDILFLDADNNCLEDPTFLFDSLEYKKNGAVFWPDYWKTAADNPIWEIIGSMADEMHEQESGQILINKEKCWRPLNLCVYFNRKKHIFHRLLYGDKDTFKFAWQALQYDFHMISTDVACCGYGAKNDFLGCTMAQHDFSGNILFLHRNLLPWDVTLPIENNAWQQMKKFKKDAVTKEYILSYNRLRCHSYMDIKGDIIHEKSPINVRELEKASISVLCQLRQEPFYHRFLIHCHLRSKRHGNVAKGKT